MIAKTLLKRIARVALGDYGAYYVYCIDAQDALAAASSVANEPCGPIEPGELANASQYLADVDWYLGEGSDLYGYRIEGQLVGVAVGWFGPRYGDHNFWPLGESEAHLIEMRTTEAARGRGVATVLMRVAAADYARRGFTRIFGRVWHSHEASHKVLSRAGFRKCGRVWQFEPFGVFPKIQWRRGL